MWMVSHTPVSDSAERSQHSVVKHPGTSSPNTGLWGGRAENVNKENSDLSFIFPKVPQFLFKWITWYIHISIILPWCGMFFNIFRSSLKFEQITHYFKMYMYLQRLQDRAQDLGDGYQVNHDHIHKLRRWVMLSWFENHGSIRLMFVNLQCVKVHWLFTC